MPSYLPQSNGYLPYWLMINSVLCFGNSLQCFTKLEGVRKVYDGSNTNTPTPQVTGLSARTFGAYTLVTGILRLVTAYNISNSPLYGVTLAAYAVVVGHWGSEWLKYKTVAGGLALYGSIIMDGGGLLWMLSQWKGYAA